MTRFVCGLRFIGWIVCDLSRWGMFTRMAVWGIGIWPLRLYLGREERWSENLNEVNREHSPHED